jgi:hypothetical protein
LLHLFVCRRLPTTPVAAQPNRGGMSADARVVLSNANARGTLATDVADRTVRRKIEQEVAPRNAA